MDSVSTSFTHLYGTHHSWLLGLLRRRLNDRWDAADLAHDTFIRILGRPLAETDHVGQRSYLATIARGLCIDHWRRRQLERTWLQTLAERPGSAGSRRRSSGRSSSKPSTKWTRCSRACRRRSARPFYSRTCTASPYKQIAVQLGVCERMVKKYMAQALLHCAILEAELDGMLVQ